MTWIAWLLLMALPWGVALGAWATAESDLQYNDARRVAITAIIFDFAALAAWGWLSALGVLP